MTPVPATSLPDRALLRAKVDGAPAHRRPSPVRLAAAAIVSAGGSLGLNALLVHFATNESSSVRTFSHFRAWDYGTLTVLGALLGCAGWAAVTRISSAPRWLFLRLAAVAMLALWLPDLWLLVRGESATGVGALMVMHLVVAVVTYNAAVHLAPVREPVSATVAADSDAATSSEVTARRLAGVLACLVGVEFGLGIALLFFIPAGRPTGWVPGKGAGLYAAHALLGVPLAIGAVALVARARRMARTFQMAGWMGFSGVALAGIGGLLTVPHPARLAGMALMLIGPMIAGFGYLIPTLDRLSPGSPPAAGPSVMPPAGRP